MNFLMVGHGYGRGFFIYGFATTPQERNFDISLDGTFIATLKTKPSQSEDRASLHINTVLNWFEQLRATFGVYFEIRLSDGS